MNDTAKHAEKEFGILTYTVTILLLFSLTLGSYFLSRAHLAPSSELMAAMGIAVVKSTLVALIFMGLLHQEVSNQIVLLVAVAFVVALLLFTVGDVVTRQISPIIPPTHVPTP